MFTFSLSKFYTILDGFLLVFACSTPIIILGSQTEPNFPIPKGILYEKGSVIIIFLFLFVVY